MLEDEREQLIEQLIDKAVYPERHCSHWAQHTVYGSQDPSRNGTWCQVCRERVA